MFSKRCDFVMVLVIFLFLQGAAGFFVKHVNTGECISATNEIYAQGNWGIVYFVELSNNCLDPAAQFRFRNNSAMLNLKKQGCFEVRFIRATGTDIEIFDVFAHPGHPLDTGDACRDIPHRVKYRAITQTSGGALSVRYQRRDRFEVENWCAIPVSDNKLRNKGIDTYIGGTTPCDKSSDERFHFGSVTCYGNKTENVNCPKDQYMVIKTASYCGLPDTKTCGSSDDYTCQVDATCRIKKLCDGQHECNITVDDNLLPSDFCQGMMVYLYFEYQCIDTPTAYLCVKDIRLLHSSLPNEGFVQIETAYNGTKSVCWQSLDNNATNTVCRQLGYGHTLSLLEKTAPADVKETIFSGRINCTSRDQALSQCSVTDSQRTCSTFSYISCFICNNPLLKDKERIPDASFTASASSQGHSASEARISSGSSWCAPDSGEKHYLQVDLGGLYSLDIIAIFGDSTSDKWVTSYSLNYTTDLMKWDQVQINGQMTFDGPKNSSSYAAIQNFTGVIARGLRFIPIAYEVQPCMRIEICETTLLPNKPSNLTVTKITSRSAEISWLSPENEGNKPVDQFRIKLMKNGTLIQNHTTRKVDKQEIDNLTPFTIYEVSVAAGNARGFGEKNVATFKTSEDVPESPPLNIKVTVQNSSSLLVLWKPPEKDKQNGVIVSYTVCISHSDNEHCSKRYTTNEQQYNIRNLAASTKYYIRVRASTKVGPGNYSKSEVKITKGIPPAKAINRTKTTLTFPLQIPSRNYTHFYVVAFNLSDGKTPNPPDSYSNNDLVTYTEGKNPGNPQPYIAAVVTSSGMAEDLQFVLGDGRTTSNPTTRRRRSTTKDYFNGPLEPGTSYSIFQRIFINENEYYSTDWSPASETNPEPTEAHTATPTTPRPEGPRVLSNMSSGDIKAKEGDLVNLLCSAQGEPPITFTWEKDLKKIESFTETQKPYRSSFLVLTVEDQTNFGNYICHIQNRFDSTTHTMRILKDTGAEDNCNGSRKYIVGIIVLAILLIISLVVLVYFVYRNHFKLSSTQQHVENKTTGRNVSKDIIYENPNKDGVDNYEQDEDEQSTYAALKRSGKDKQDDHLYTHLNVEHSDYANQQETGI